MEYKMPGDFGLRRAFLFVYPRDNSYICNLTKQPLPMEEAKFPVSLSNFESIRTNDFVYVDKTQYVYSLVKQPGYYFLSRPRRFGKSMLLSTIAAYFEGKKDLFNGLKIEELKKDEWVTLPVLRLDMSGKTYQSKDELVSMLDMYLRRWEMAYGIEQTCDSVSGRFFVVIETMAKKIGKKVVVLVDEYDNPLISSVGNKELQEFYRDLLGGFYSVLKKAEEHIYFCMLTGVTGYSNISIFSGLNNLYDISLDNKYAGICGITEEELHSCFMAEIEELAEEEVLTVEETLRQLKINYGGYHFSRSLLDIYNPYSVINALGKIQITDYWSRSGFPTFLFKLLKNKEIDFEDLNGILATENILTNSSLCDPTEAALLYQTGYLTIKHYDRSSQLYTLGYPNKEAEQGLLVNLRKR